MRLHNKLITTSEKMLREKGALRMQVERKILVAPGSFQDGEEALPSSPRVFYTEVLTKKYWKWKKSFWRLKSTGLTWFKIKGLWAASALEENIFHDLDLNKVSWTLNLKQHI